MLKRILRALIGLAIIFVGLFVARALIGMKQERPVFSPPKAVKLVKTTPALLRSESPHTYVKGRAVAIDRIEVFAEVNGVVLPASKLFRTGVRFEKGEPLLKLDAGELEMTLVAQRSAFLQLLTGILPDLKVDYPAVYEKWRKYTAELEVTEALGELPPMSNEQEKFFLSNRGILNQYYTVRSSEERLTKFTLIAPFSGEVVMSTINPGALVRSGQKIGEFVSLAGFEVESAIPRAALDVVQVGDSVAFQAEVPGNTIPGRVTRILRTIDPSTQTAKVFCAVDYPGLRDGVYLNGIIYSREMPGVMRIQRELLVTNNALFTVENDTILRLTPVTVKVSSERDALISGIDSSAVLLAEPIANASDGMIVRIERQ